MSTVLAQVEAETGYELPFYLIQTFRPNWRFFNPWLNKEYGQLIDMEKANTLRDKYPKHDRPLAAMFVNKAMIEDSLWSQTDPEGNLATANPELAAYVLLAAQRKNPKARMHKYSKKLEPQHMKSAQDKIPSPQSYNLKPKDVLNIKGNKDDQPKAQPQINDAAKHGAIKAP